MGIVQNFYRQYPIDSRVIIANICKNVEAKFPINATELELDQIMINQARGLLMFQSQGEFSLNSKIKFTNPCDRIL